MRHWFKNGVLCIQTSQCCTVGRPLEGRIHLEFKRGNTSALLLFHSSLFPFSIALPSLIHEVRLTLAYTSCKTVHSRTFTSHFPIATATALFQTKYIYMYTVSSTHKSDSRSCKSFAFTAQHHQIWCSTTWPNGSHSGYQ